MSATVFQERGSSMYSYVDAAMSGPGEGNQRLASGIDAEWPGTRDRTTSDESVVDDPRYAAVRADVEARLRGVCAGMSADLFDELLRGICTRKIRWARDEEEPSSQ